MDFNPTRDVRSVQYQDVSYEPQWAADPRKMVNVEDRGQLYPMRPSSQSNMNPKPTTRDDPFIIEQLKSRIEIAKKNCEFYEQLLQSKNDCSIQFGKKNSLLDNLISEHQNAIRETKQNAERAEKVSKAIIFLLKQADGNNGCFSPTLQSKAEIATKALAHLKGIPPTPKIDQLAAQLASEDQIQLRHNEQINNKTKLYQNEIQQLEKEFVQLQQEQMMRKQAMYRKSSQDLNTNLEPPESLPSPKAVLSAPKEVNKKIQDLDELDELEQDSNGKDDDDIWAVFQKADSQRTIENEEKLEQSEVQKAEIQKSQGVVFLSDQEAAAIDQERVDKKVKKETNINQFWDDLNNENDDIQERDDDDDDMMGPTARNSRKSSSSSISISFGLKGGKKKSPRSSNKPPNRTQKRTNTNPTNIFLTFKPTAGIVGKKYPPLIPGATGNHPFPSTSHECLRVVG